MSKKITITGVLSLLVLTSALATEVQGRVQLNQVGRLYLALNQGGYVPDGADPDFGFQAEVGQGEKSRGWVEFRFEDVPPGEYVIQGFVDTNGNGELDLGMFGPTEPYGFSNKAKGIFGMPSWQEVRFTVGESGASQELDFR